MLTANFWLHYRVSFRFVSFRFVSFHFPADVETLFFFSPQRPGRLWGPASGLLLTQKGTVGNEAKHRFLIQSSRMRAFITRSSEWVQGFLCERFVT